jgi:hypothetical protein
LNLPLLFKERLSPKKFLKINSRLKSQRKRRAIIQTDLVSSQPTKRGETNNTLLTENTSLNMKKRRTFNLRQKEKALALTLSSNLGISVKKR